MKKYLLLFYIPFIIGLFRCSNNKAEVIIEITANNLPAGSSVYITGNDLKLGNWQPNLIGLQKNEEGKWVKRISFEKGKKLEFKITRGTWQTEALNPDSSIPPNYSFEALSDTTIEITVSLWADQIERKVEGQITGNVNYHKDFEGEGIKPRDIIVWLPPDYDLDANKRYPVLYMHDGQNIIDPATSTFQIDWQIDEAADTLIRNGMIEPIIIVGVYNSSDRSTEYNEDSLGVYYTKFIVDSLKPFIDTNYRTKPGGESTATGGSSLGALISFIIMWEHPEVFSKALCFSPAFKIEKYDFIDNVVSYTGKNKDIKVYINNGDGELDSQLQPSVDEMLEVLINKGYVVGKDFYFNKDKNSQHGERDWSKSIWRALIFLFGTEKGKELL
jgi:predicted alpha/beta superfamily hydrolase